MKKYLVVAYDGYYPDADLRNIRFHTDDLKEAETVLEIIKRRRLFDYFQIMNRDKFIPNSQDRFTELLEEYKEYQKNE